MPSTSVTSFEMMVDANTDPTATTNTKSNTLSFDRVLLPDPRKRMISAVKPTIERVNVRPMLYQLSKKKGGCGNSLDMMLPRTPIENAGTYSRDRASR